MIVWRFLVEPYKAIGHFVRGSDQIPLPRQILRPYRLRLWLLTVGAPLGVAGALVRDRRGNDLPGPAGILVHEGNPGCHVWKMLFSSSVPLQSLPDLPVCLPESSATRGGEEPIPHPGRPVYGRLDEGTDVDGDLPVRTRLER